MVIGDRIKSVRLSMSMNQTEFGSKIGIKAAGVSKIENGDRNPSEPVVRAICREFSVDYAWLTDGVGEMYSAVDDEVMAALDDLMTGEHENTRALIRTLAKLSEAELDMVDRFIEKFRKELGD